MYILYNLTVKQLFPPFQFLFFCFNVDCIQIASRIRDGKRRKKRDESMSEIITMRILFTRLLLHMLPTRALNVAKFYIYIYIQYVYVVTGT